MSGFDFEKSLVEVNFAMVIFKIFYIVEFIIKTKRARGYLRGGSIKKSMK